MYCRVATSPPDPLPGANPGQPTILPHAAQRQRNSYWQRWVHRPQSLRWRRFSAQLHLWLGVALAVYVAILSLTGSMIVLRPDFHRWLIPREVPVQGVRLSGEALNDAVRLIYADFEVTSLEQPQRLDKPVLVILRRGEETIERLFDPYASADLGPAYPALLRAVEWLVDLHDNLLSGRTGRIVNGIGGALLTLLCISGLVVWWPGKGHWRQALLVGRPAKSVAFARRLHVALGFWLSALLLVWAVTAVYFAFPWLFDRALDWLAGDSQDALRPGEELLDFLVHLHFGRFGGLAGRLSWILLGLLPTVLVISGIIMWCKRVMRPHRSANLYPTRE